MGEEEQERLMLNISCIPGFVVGSPVRLPLQRKPEKNQSDNLHSLSMTLSVEERMPGRPCKPLFSGGGSHGASSFSLIFF